MSAWSLKEGWHTMSSEQTQTNNKANSFSMEYFDINLENINKENISLNPLDSDYRKLSLVMKHLVGTLVKHGSKSSYEPYLASNWKTSPDGKTWEFNLRNNLIASDGSEITASTYVKSLKKLALLYKKNKKKVILLPDLIGWDSFNATDDDLEGLDSVGDSLIRFTFKEKPKGVLQYLSMPYLGFYTSSNFNENGDWADNHKIVSSNSFELHEIQSDKIILKSREWFTISQHSPKTVRIHFGKKVDLSKLSSDSNQTIVTSQKVIEPLLESDQFTQIFTSPSQLAFVSLNPSNPLLSNSNNRVLIRNTIRNIKKEFFNSNPQYIDTDFFYFLHTSDVTNTIENRDLSNLKGGELTLLTSKDKNNNFASEMNPIIKKAIESLGVRLNLIYKEDIKNFVETVQTGKYDMWLGSVVNGSSIENWVVNMMWCTNMGVSFFDPSNKICKLTEMYDTLDNLEIDNKYISTLNQAIEDDATVLPVAVFGDYFYVSNDISPDGIDHLYSTIWFDKLKER